jgi:hypothetical protein
MKHGLSLACVAVVTALTGCAAFTPQVNPKVYGIKKFAIGAYYGPTAVIGGSGMAGLISSTANRWGTKVAEITVDEVHSRLQSAFKAELLPIDQVVANPAYAQAPVIVPHWRNMYVAPRGMVALSVDQKSDAALGQLARALGVDAVIVLKNDWKIGQQGSDQVGKNTLEILIMGADGTRLWDQTGLRAGTAEAKVGTSIGSQIAGAFGSLTEETAVAMSRAAIRASLDQFVDAWGRRPGQ